MTNNIFTRKRIAAAVLGSSLAVAIALPGIWATNTTSAIAATVAAAKPAPPGEHVHLSSAPVAIVYGADASVFTGTFKNMTDAPAAVAIYAGGLDSSSFTDGELRATRVLSTVEAGLESNTVETSLGHFASTDTVTEQIGASSMEVDPGEIVSYSVRITPPAEGDPKLDRKPFITNINLAASFQVRDSEEAGS
jgi:hypothetical protein